MTKGLHLRTWQADLLLMAVAAIWGATFPVVKNATDVAHGGVPVYWFLAARFTLAALLLGLLFYRRLAAAPLHTWVVGGMVGTFLFAAYSLQTFGLAYTTSSKAGFITGLNVVLVPILTVIWLRQKPAPGAWLGVGMAAVGLALLSLNGSLMPTFGDLLVLLCAFGFALHIAAVGRYAGPHDPVALAVIQIGAAALLAWILHLATAESLAPGVPDVDWWSGPARVVMATVICGVLATAAAFLLQNCLQPYTTPTHTALVLSGEPVWSAIFSYFMLGETLPLRGYIGAALILIGMVLAEIPFRPRLREAGVEVGDW